jgi:hypothetical protein
MEFFDLEKLRKQEIEYLKSLAESGSKIPKEKVGLFKLLVLKEDPLKVGENMLKKSLYLKNANSLFASNKKSSFYWFIYIEPRANSHDFDEIEGLPKKMQIIEKARLKLEEDMKRDNKSSSNINKKHESINSVNA